MTRKELFAKIRVYGLQEYCKMTYGKDYTKCKSDALQEAIEYNLGSLNPEPPKYKEAILFLTNNLLQKNLLGQKAADYVASLLG